MILDYKCEKCGYVKEEYYSSYKLIPMFISCEKCQGQMKKMFSSSHHITDGHEVAGYEKENEGKLTLGKLVDSTQKWV